MSADSHAPAAGHHEPSKYHFYIKVAMILSVVTGIEVVLVYLPIAKWFVVTALITLSAGKFLAVIFYFMHLRWDKVFCTGFFGERLDGKATTWTTDGASPTAPVEKRGSGRYG